MLTCFACKAKFSDTRSLCHHLRSMCFLTLNKTVYNCGEEGCFRHFHCIKSLSKHINSCHSSREPFNSDICNPSTFKDQEALSSASTVTLHDVSLSATTTNHAISHSVESAKSILNRDMCTFIASLYANPVIPRSTVQVVIEGMQSFLEHSMDNVMKSRFRELVGEGIVNKNSFNVVEEMLNLLKTSINDFRSEHRRLETFSKAGTFISPIEVTVGQRMEQKRTRLGLSYLPVNCTMQFTALHLILQKFFTLPNILRETLDYLAVLKCNYNTGPVTNFIQGSVWRNMESNRSSDEDVILPLILYFDDFEIGNPHT